MSENIADIADSEREGGNMVVRAVNFLKLLASSSLGTPMACEERLAGRKETDAFEGVQTGMKSVASNQERNFDLRVGIELDMQGSTFEAELRYRAALNPNEADTASSYLAASLEAKGHY